MKAAAGRAAPSLAPGERDPAAAIKLLVWDLDDTLWQGTLAEGDDVVLHERRAAFVRAFNRCGLVSAICSKNDASAARAVLERLGLWDAFVFPRIAFVPKGAAVRQLIDDMQLRPENTLFIDDNMHNIHEVSAAAPGIRTLDATSQSCDAELEKILLAHKDVHKSRVEEYRLLQARVDDRRQSDLSNEAFLADCDIRAVVTRWMDNIDFADRIEQLVNRSNQLNYTGSRMVPGSLTERIMDIMNVDTRCVFLRDRYGDHGLIGFALVESATETLTDFVFSCRIMHMGVEQFMLDTLRKRYSRLDLSRLIKPLPHQRADAIHEDSFAEPAVRARILTQQACPAPARIGLRIMCDCQSGAIAHYSRFGDEIDFDNSPRLFSLPMMVTGEYLTQQFAPMLVYSPATEYLDWRWSHLMPELTEESYRISAESFCRFVSASGSKMLSLLPPTNAAKDKYYTPRYPTRTFVRERGVAFNAIWANIAATYPDSIRCIEISNLIAESEMLDANHYLPSAFPRIAAAVDEWYSEGRG